MAESLMGDLFSFPASENQKNVNVLKCVDGPWPLLQDSRMKIDEVICTFRKRALVKRYLRRDSVAVVNCQWCRRSSGPTHVYLFRLLPDLWSFGMDKISEIMGKWRTGYIFGDHWPEICALQMQIVYTTSRISQLKLFITIVGFNQTKQILGTIATKSGYTQVRGALTRYNKYITLATAFLSQQSFYELIVGLLQVRMIHLNIRRLWHSSILVYKSVPKAAKLAQNKKCRKLQQISITPSIGKEITFSHPFISRVHCPLLHSSSGLILDLLVQHLRKIKSVLHDQNYKKEHFDLISKSYHIIVTFFSSASTATSMNATSASSLFFPCSWCWWMKVSGKRTQDA